MDLMGVFLHDTTWTLVLEIIIRCCVMFLLILVFLKLSGKRGIRQLSIFEVAIILSLGSTAGDPMFIDDAPIVQAFVVMDTIIILYRFVTWTMMKNKKVEILLEGKPLCIVEDGLLVIQDMQKKKYSHDEFFAEIRQKSVEHLGQVKVALLETDGCLSILLYAKEDTKWGLPLFPQHYKKADNLNIQRYYSCMYCGLTQRCFI
ncbi:hypothetical protein F909_02306 [Acinetobacter sp. ANC 3929]|nr:hypothetical protein F909_02306 [Acinetobacter sp. ANC 3929]